MCQLRVLLLMILSTQISGHAVLKRRADADLSVNTQVNLPQMPDLSQSHGLNSQLNSNGPDYSLQGYISSMYNYMPGISTIKSLLQSALSYLPSGSSLYNAICKALNAVTPDYATLKALYDQVRAQTVQDREAFFRHHEEMMRIKHGYPDAPGLIGQPNHPGGFPQGPSGVLIN